MLNLSRFVLAACLLALPVVVSADDWPQWRGPGRDDVSKETGLLPTWPASGPKLAWTFENAGMGFTAPAVVGGVVYTMGARDNDEFVIALDLAGKELWSTKIGPVYDFPSNNWSRGPAATPTVDGGLLYGLGSQGELVCLETKGGKVVWQKNLPAAMAGEVNDVGGGPPKMGWGYTWSPLVDGDKLVITPGGPGGLFAALDKKTGNVLWRSVAVKDPATYSSPVVADCAGVHQYIAVVQNGIVAVSAANGSLLWEHRRETPYADVVCPTPIVHGDQVFVSVGYNGGSALLKITKAGAGLAANPVYAMKEIGSRQGGVVLANGYVYGAHEARGWMCEEFATGKKKWESTRRAIGIGPLAYADGRLYAVSEDKGEVAMIEASPAAFKQLAKFRLPKESTKRKQSGRIWSHPVIADGKLYLRDQELIFCYEIK
jgi:outer membrane protein assembly factor BamB